MSTDDRRLHALDDDQRRERNPAREAHDALETALFEIKRVIVGPGGDARARDRRAAGRRARPARGRAGPGQDAHRQDRLRRPGRLLQAPAVHPRPRARGPRGHEDLPGRHRRLRHRARAGVLQLPARRRDQPRAREGPVGAAGGHAGAPGHDRPREPPRAGAVPGHGHAEPDRVRGHLRAARGAGRPLHVQARGRLPRHARRGRRRRALARHARAGARGALARVAGAAPARRGAVLRRPAGDGVRGGADHRHARGRASTAGSSSAPARAARST